MSLGMSKSTGAFLVALAGTAAAEDGGDAAVDGDGRAGDERRVVAGEEGDQAADLLGLTDATDGVGGAEHAEDLGVAVRRSEDGGVDDAGADRVDADAVAGEVGGGGLHESDHAELG